MVDTASVGKVIVYGTVTGFIFKTTEIEKVVTLTGRVVHWSEVTKAEFNAICRALEDS